jgi:transcriptional regulator with XRE-family HTH domain
MELASKIKSLRKEKNVNQKELAEISGVSQAAINKIETGKTKSPSIDIAIKIADALDVDIYELYGTSSGWAKLNDNATLELLSKEKESKFSILASWSLDVLGEISLLQTVRDEYVNKNNKDTIQSILNNLKESFITSLIQFKKSGILTDDEILKLQNKYPNFPAWNELISELLLRIPINKDNTKSQRIY